jgi:hypothetical protein
MTKEACQKGARPREPIRIRGPDLKRKREDGEDGGETEPEFRAWLENRAMKTDAAIMKMEKTLERLMEGLEDLQKKERSTSKGLRKLEKEVTEFRTEAREGLGSILKEQDVVRTALDGVTEGLREVKQELYEPGSESGEKKEMEEGDGVDGTRGTEDGVEGTKGTEDGEKSDEEMGGRTEGEEVDGKTDGGDMEVE